MSKTMNTVDMRAAPGPVSDGPEGRRLTPCEVPTGRVRGDDSPEPASEAWSGGRAARNAAFAYGVICYVAFFLTFLYAVGFLGNILVPKSIDSGRTAPIGIALAINAALLGIFAVQHSVMARPSFKRVWTRIVPKPVERSTYTLLSSVALILLFWLWQPLGGVVWHVEGPAATALYAAFGAGWLLVLAATFLINHFDLFGLRQVWLYFRGKPYTHLKFQTPGLYRVVRHPLYVGWLLCFWATPTMTISHLVFAIGTTAYILFAIQLEERNLIDVHGRKYVDYRRRVRGLIPIPRSRRSEAEPVGTPA